MTKKNITIYDIAKEANVSPTTVSRVLTGNPLVKESTRDLVLKIIEKMEFTPNEAARSLTKKQTNMIGFIVPDITNPFFSQVYIEAEKLAIQHGYTILLRNSLARSEMESDCLREFIERRVECIVFMGGRVNKTSPDPKEVNEMREVVKRIPVIMVNGDMEGVDCYKIRTDDEEGIRLIVAHLVELGHQKISLIGGAIGITATDIKVDSFRRELASRGLKYEEKWQIFTGFGIDHGKEAMKMLLANDDLPTAIIGMNDMVLYGALKECREQNIQIQDFSFVGYDDIFPSDIVYPSLTTINQNYPHLGAEIVSCIRKIINGESVEKDTIIESKLIIRESSQRAVE